MGAAIIDDVLALLALSISQGIVGGAVAPLQLFLSFGKAAAFLVIAAWPARMLLRRLTLRLDDTRLATRYPESMFVFAMMVAFLFSLAAEVAGLSAVVGSFLAGVCFTGDILKRCDIFETGSQHLRVIFASIFFISLGVLLDVRALTPSLLLFALALTAVAILAKFVGCGAPARLLGFRGKDWQVVGVGMAPRGEVAMVVSLIGLSAGLFDPPVYAALILMSLLTTVAAPLLLKVLYQGEKATSNL
jgi:Kef-type K+ transport system membrane component KefB